MSFYYDLSSFYDGVFPLNAYKLKFIQDNIIKEGLAIDVACGVGIDAIALTKQGYNIEGFDLESEMIIKAVNSAKQKQLKIKFFEASMLDINKYYDNNSISSLLCTGNSLVHLNTKNEIINFINNSYKLLKTKGILLIQIINFDRVLDNNITQLPTIVNNEQALTFTRNYEYCPKSKKIKFVTTLKAHKEYKNVINLIPLRQQELQQILNKAGFNTMKFYGSFKGDSYTPTSYATVVIAKK